MRDSSVEIEFAPIVLTREEYDRLWGSVSTITRVDFDQQVDELVGESGGIPEDAPWFCVRTEPFPCPAEGCDFVAVFMTAAHRIVVWPSKDDIGLLRRADLARRIGRNPHVVEYRAEYGPCIPFDLWRQLGGPVHGKLDQDWEPAGF